MTDTTLHFDPADHRFAPASNGVLGPLVAAAIRATVRLLAAARARHAAEHRARQVAEVRALAHRYRDTDRGFCSDLCAAADRHEEAVLGS